MPTHKHTHATELPTLRAMYDDVELSIVFDWLKWQRPPELDAIDLI